MKHVRWWVLPVALLVSASAVSAFAVPSTAASQGRLLRQAERLKLKDRSRFAQILKQLGRDSPGLSARQRWHLKYLDAWQAGFTGRISRATSLLNSIIAHSGEPALIMRARALMINLLVRGNHYEQAYALSNIIIANLPNISNARARADALRQIVQLLSSARQDSLALQYARQLGKTRVPGESPCPVESYALNALFKSANLHPDSPRLRKGIESCLSSDDLVYANTLRLDRAYLLIKYGKAKQAISLLKRITPSILKESFQPHVASLHATLAEAYLNAGNRERARKIAFDIIAARSHGDYAWALQAAYKVIYKTDESSGDYKGALSYYRKYTVLNSAYRANTKAHALAYQMVKQQVEAKKLRLEALSRKNRILKLKQALAKKASETSRLYVALLVIAIIFIILWLYRLKHSQLHFRRMARHDDLTGVFNRKHFLDETKRVLRRLSGDGENACLVIVDLDHFKRINDRYGHIAGDAVLQQTVAVSRRELRASDVFGRLGGEEFGILMPACSSAQGVEIGERMRQVLASTQTHLHTGDAVTVSASFGLASTDMVGYDLVKLLTHADSALYTAKRNGRNRLVVGSQNAMESRGRDSQAHPHPISD